MHISTYAVTDAVGFRVSRCISAALNMTQAGLSVHGWNQKFREGEIRVSKGATSWPLEMPVAPNMTLRIIGEG